MGTVSGTKTAFFAGRIRDLISGAVIMPSGVDKGIVVFLNDHPIPICFGSGK